MAARGVATPPELPGLRYSRLLGSGGFSDVYLYEQELPKRLVAVKVLASDDLSDSSRAAFVAEANLMAQLSAHPYIVTIYHAAVAPDGRPYFVMEYCSGPSLAEQYKRSQFNVADALRTGVRVSSAVATAHAAGILHRDIKPANVLTNSYGWPALTDFGISSAVDIELPVNAATRAANNAGGATATGSIGMSIPWSPPEMFDDHPQPDVRSDVFSLAATLYTLLEGHTPFEVPGKPNGTVDLIGRIERGTITPITRADIPRSLVAILNKGMAVSADDRFATAVDFARALQRVEMELSYAPTAIDVPNLTVLERVHDEEAADAGDVTRIRGVSTVHAQPLAPAPTTAPVSAPTAGADPTVIRRMPSVQPHESPAASPVAENTVLRPRTSGQAEAGPADAASPGEAAPAPRRKLWPILTGAAGVLVIGGVVAAALVFAPENEDPQPTPTATSDIITVGVPTPDSVSVTPNDAGTSFTFTWANPDPQDGDRYMWHRSDGSDTGNPVSTEDESVTIDGVTNGDDVCIEVSIRRSSGKTSTEPLEMCSR
ncbi:serine/threonine protein kinase [Mycetocola manganoxydans]|uniref:non-specific serine/threonine protein kinase n=1 Tax=Mycetocola manganoxydans TaxID=699879 RepID=A0A3L6ZVD9_9MICO|nr:serine/threonine-protein kinase [Mycetocola manganoxydans]RLP71963.1 serine/threonine protein kinase [Mycetocola manganoxydans]GHD47301.1 serine/threonine protein kinase [Mycetocola manganoxydans]